MPRIDLDDPNVELLEVTATKVREWLDAPGESDWAEELENKLDEAQGAVFGGDAERVRYLVIKVTTGVG
jgi:hypothetical protein